MSESASTNGEGGPSLTATGCIEERIREFEYAVQSSGQYAWIGLVQGEDGLRRPRLGVYLVKRSDPVLTISPVNVGAAFDALAREMRSTITLDLFFIMEKGSQNDEWRQIAERAAKQEYFDSQFVHELRFAELKGRSFTSARWTQSVTAMSLMPSTSHGGAHLNVFCRKTRGILPRRRMENESGLSSLNSIANLIHLMGAAISARD